MQRVIRPEILDELPTDDPRAVQSRRDLQKVNTVMRHRAFVTRVLRRAPAPRLVVELGAGDGTFLLKVARHLAYRSRVHAILVDRHAAVSEATRNGFATAGWDVETCKADVFEWLCRPHADTADATLANLFLHHFQEGELATLLTLAAQQTRRFIACEPRRSRTGLAGASLLGLIGCNDVTIHDADISVRAGFLDSELSKHWPADRGWHVTEQRRGLFTHVFVAALDQESSSSASRGRESRASE